MRRFALVLLGAILMMPASLQAQGTGIVAIKNIKFKSHDLSENQGITLLAQAIVKELRERKLDQYPDDGVMVQMLVEWNYLDSDHGLHDLKVIYLADKPNDDFYGIIVKMRHDTWIGQPPYITIPTHQQLADLVAKEFVDRWERFAAQTKKSAQRGTQ